MREPIASRRLVMVIATCPQPIPFSEMPVRLIFLIGVPKASRSGLPGNDLVPGPPRAGRPRRRPACASGRFAEFSYRDSPSTRNLAEWTKIGENKQKRTLSPLLRRLLRLKFWVVERFRLSERQLTLIWAALIGVLGALASESFRKASEVLHYLGDRIGFEHHLLFFQSALVAETGCAHGGRTSRRPHSLAREPSLRQYPPENDHRLHGSDRRWQRYYLCARESRQKLVSSLLDQHRNVDRPRGSPRSTLFARGFAGRKVSKISDPAAAASGGVRSGRRHRQRLQRADRGVLFRRRNHFRDSRCGIARPVDSGFRRRGVCFAVPARWRATCTNRRASICIRAGK